MKMCQKYHKNTFCPC